MERLQQKVKDPWKENDFRSNPLFSHVTSLRTGGHVKILLLYNFFPLALVKKKNMAADHVFENQEKASTPRHRLRQESAFPKPVFNRENTVFYRKDRHFF